jgi:NAD+ synthase (glutamine-hydrolysing)
MKIALAQLNYHIGNFESNAEKIINAIFNAENENVDLVIFSELSVCGYCPLDLLEQEDFISKCLNSIQHIKSYTSKVAIIIGAPTINSQNKGKNLFNSALFIHEGEIKHVFHKTLLPTYDIFDEYRYFEPNDVFELLEFKNEKIAVTICEDLWDEQKTYNVFDREMLYKSSPLQKLNELQPDFVINIAASPYSYNQAQTRQEILFKNAIKYSLPIIYVNQIGGNTDLIFDGGSMVVNKKGQKVLDCNCFDEDFKIINSLEIKKLAPINYNSFNKIEDIHKALILGLKDFFKKSGFKKAVLGLSGGIDSALTLAIAIQAIGNKNIDVILMPSKYSSQHSIDDAIEMAKRCNVNYHIVNIESIRQEFDSTLDEIFENTLPDVTEENIQARIRGSILMAFSNKFGHIVLNTSNKSEAAVGYSTLYGDMNGAISVLGDVYKTDIYKLAEYINLHIANIIPENTINKPPSAELRPNQKDNDSLPDYNILDAILFAYIEQKLSIMEIEKQSYEKGIVDFVINLVNKSEYKRFQSPPILRISSKSFGFGRRMPLIAKYF